MLRITTCHLIKNPAGRWSFVGRIPVSLCNDRDATLDDIMGRRWHERPDGSKGCYSSMSFETEQAARDFVASVGETLAN